jgi:proton-coupled amino acid transporter
MIGTAIFSFEGIGLVIPVTDAMREPHKFPKVLSGVMISLMCASRVCALGSVC